MNLELSEEQQMLRDSVDRFVAQAYGFAERRGIAESPMRSSPAVWQSMADFGWLALPLPEADGGLGGTSVDVGILMQGLGRGLVLEPVLGSSVLAAGLVAGQGTSRQRARWLPGIADGSRRAAFAHIEPGVDPWEGLPATRAARTASGWRIDGAKPFVPDAPGASMLVVSARLEDSRDIGLFVLEPGVAGLRSETVETWDDRLAATLTFDALDLSAEALLGTDGDSGAMPADARPALAAALDRTVAAMCAEAVACMEVLLEATIEHTRTRQQFGRPLSENQVLRHLMVDMAVRCEEARAMALRAAHACDADGDAAARARAVSGARLKIGDASRFVAQSAVQLHGAMGVTDELNIGAYFRRLLCIDTTWGTAAEHRARCIGLRRAGVSSGMELELAADDRRFRDEVRAFIAEHLPEALARGQRMNPSVVAEPDQSMPWHQVLHSRGWSAPGWPVEYGGTGWTPVQRLIFDAECARADAPPLSPFGLKMVGPVLIGFGSPEQKERFLPGILSGEVAWCQGYSEPGSGSDLASLKTRATRDGDHYVVNGTKIWTTHAHHADWMFALVRTGDGPRKQDGISFLLIDMKSPGITIRPIRTMGGDHEVNQVFFDDVRVPVANRVGDEGRGWSYGKYLLQFERGGAQFANRLRRDLSRLDAAGREAVRRGQRAIESDEIQARFVALENDIAALEMIELRIMSALQTGESPGPVSSQVKLRASELRQEITQLGVDLIGIEALVREPRRPLHAVEDLAGGLGDDVAPIVPTYLNSRAYTIFGGSSQVQRDILAKDILRI